ncbi:hypothetical protein GS907_26415 [Rhodococcus hoagii]|nr:hypothetical protein [Prescottella equi]
MHGFDGQCVPHAIGAQCAEPGRQVVAMSGDGGLSMLLGELITFAMYRLPVKIVVFDNSTSAWSNSRCSSMVADCGVDVPSVDYAAVATALGITDAGSRIMPIWSRGSERRSRTTDPL